jgi:hypothetical protein
MHAGQQFADVFATGARGPLTARRARVSWRWDGGPGG